MTGYTRGLGLSVLLLLAASAFIPGMLSDDLFAIIAFTILFLTAAVVWGRAEWIERRRSHRG